MSKSKPRQMFQELLESLEELKKTREIENMKARTPETKAKEQPQSGTHAARLLGIVDLGHQPGFVWDGKPVPSEYKLEFTYELVNHLMEDGRPFVVSEQLTNKNWEDAKTGRASTLTSRAKSLCPDTYKEAVTAIETMLGKACMVSVKLNDKGYAKVSGQAAVGSVPFGMEVPELTNKPYIFDMNDPDMELYESFPDFKKERITSALNFDESELAKRLAEGDQY